MKLVILTSRFPWPIEKGDKLRIYHQLRFLSIRHEIFLISIVDTPPAAEDLEELNQYCHHIEYFTITKFQRWSSALLSWVNGKPAQVGYFFNSSIKKKIYQEIISYQPDRIYCQLLRMTEYVKTLPFLKVLDYMDSFSSGMRRQAEVRPFPQNILYRTEANLTKAYERYVYSFFDETAIISERDRDELPILSKNLVNVVPNGIDTEYFKPNDQTTEYDLVFVGNLGYKPNEQAVLKLLEWCRMGTFDDPIKVLIAGARPTAKILAIEEPHWEVAGWLDDIRTAYLNAKIFVAPLTTGSGLQNKLLEAMSCSLPCITTSLVNDSIGATDQVDVLLANDVSRFAQVVNELLADDKMRKEIGENARNFVLNNYQWSEFNLKLEEILIHAKSKANIAG